MAGLHRVDDGLHRSAVVGVAGEHLVAQREAVEGHHQGDADLLAVGPVIAAVAAPRQQGWPRPRPRSRCWSRRTAAPRCRSRTARRQRRDRCASSSALCSSSRSSARYSRSLLTRSPSSCSRSHSAVRRYQSSAMCSSLDGSHSRAATSTAAIFAHGTASLPDGSSFSHRSAKAGAAPQRQRQVDIAELARAFDAHALQAHRHRHIAACRRRTDRPARASRSAAAPAPALAAGPARRARQVAPPSAGSPDGRPARCAQDASSDGPCRPSSASCSASTCAHHNPIRAQKKMGMVGTTRHSRPTPQPTP